MRLVPQDYLRQFETLEQFVDSIRAGQLRHLASDLLRKGFSPADIVEGVRRAIAVCEAAGLPVEAHFRPVYSSREGTLIRDCKLSELGMALCLLNGNPNLAAVADWQLALLHAKGVREQVR